MYTRIYEYLKIQMHTVVLISLCNMYNSLNWNISIIENNLMVEIYICNSSNWSYIPLSRYENLFQALIEPLHNK